MRVFVLAAAFAALAVPAFADTPWTAVPVLPSSQNDIVGDSVIWNCRPSGCWTDSDTSSANAMSECRSLARQLGALSSFSEGKRAFSAERLVNCNDGAPQSKR